MAEDDTAVRLRAMAQEYFNLQEKLFGPSPKPPPETDPRELRISLVGNDLELGDGEPGSLDKVIASLQAARDRAPPEYRDAVRCSIEIDHGFHDSGASLDADVWYTRMETPEEVAARIAKDKADREAYKRRQEADERRKLAALKAKYGE